MPAARSERVLQCQLKLAHRDGRTCRADHPEALMRGIGRRSWKWRTGANVRLRPIPSGVVQHVERSHAELDDVLFLMTHVGLLMHRALDRLEARCEECVPSHISES